MKDFFAKRKSSVSIRHYAPDITLTAVDYYVPISHDQRMQRAEQRIKNFLAHTNPDWLCEGFYDRFADEEEKHIIALIQEQTSNHLDANHSIALKHQAELQRLLLAIQQIDSAIKAYETEIAELQKLYDHYNRLEAAV